MAASMVSCLGSLTVVVDSDVELMLEGLVVVAAPVVVAVSHPCRLPLVSVPHMYKESG